MTQLAISDLHSIDGEPRVKDLVLAERLGFGRATSVRVVISRHKDELQTYGNLHQTDVNSTTQGSAALLQPEANANVPLPRKARGRPSAGFWLNEPQALLICMFSRTEKAAEIRRQVIEVFMAWRAGQGAPSTAVTPQPANAGVLVDEKFLTDLGTILSVATIRRPPGFEPLAATMAVFQLQMILAEAVENGRSAVAYDRQGKAALSPMPMTALAGIYKRQRDAFDTARTALNENVDPESEWLLETAQRNAFESIEAIAAEAKTRRPDNETDREAWRFVLVDMAVLRGTPIDEVAKMIAAF